MVKRWLFETWLGEWLLALFERVTGLALVDANDLSHQRAPRPTSRTAQPEG